MSASGAAASAAGASVAAAGAAGIVATGAHAATNSAVTSIRERVFANFMVRCPFIQC